ncbi:MAG: hypothetical protein L3J24_05475 [Xanthomonadales bacterium]|nr:hypothetical protein [Xanthomonadales bacterium]
MSNKVQITVSYNFSIALKLLVVLALNGSGAVVRSSGTTRHSQSLPVKVDGRIL